MGIDIDSMVLVGEYVNKMPSLSNIDDICEWADDNELSYASPYFDCDRDDYILGFQLKGGDIESACIHDTINKLKDRFISITGVKAKVIITSDVW